MALLAQYEYIFYHYFISLSPDMRAHDSKMALIVGAINEMA